jgi:hypothetical protein
MLAKWAQTPDSNLPWDKLSREQALADLREYLKQGVPPQSISWKINSDPATPGRFDIAVNTKVRDDLVVHVSLGNTHPPTTLEADGGGIKLKIVHPRSDQKQTFWKPVAYFGNQWDAGWLWLYLITYIPLMFLLKWLMRIP